MVRRKHKRKYNSYKGEITPAEENVIDRDFHAAKPNQKWLTDITEFSIKAGKVYLSPIIDCLDGMPVSWIIGTSSNAELANLIRSMSWKGCSPDNSACEGFFGHLKTEMFYRRNWDQYSVKAFIQEIDCYMH